MGAPYWGSPLINYTVRYSSGYTSEPIREPLSAHVILDDQSESRKGVGAKKEGGVAPEKKRGKRSRRSQTHVFSFSALMYMRGRVSPLLGLASNDSQRANYKWSQTHVFAIDLKYTAREGNLKKQLSLLFLLYSILVYQKRSLCKKYKSGIDMPVSLDLVLYHITFESSHCPFT